MNDHLRHGLVVCRCGTVVFDCGCRLKLVGSVQICHACSGAAYERIYQPGAAQGRD